MSSLNYETLLAAASGGAAAFRARTRMQPAGGAGDKLFPPTYATGDSAATKYALETRRVDGQDVDTVLLDSVASQANRLEAALQRAFDRGELNLPMIEVDFGDEEGIQDIGRISVLEAPHRIADALLRDSVDGVLPFRLSPAGEALTESRVDHAAPLLRYCPTALVFGVWDSTGPKGGMGAKFPRALASEIVGFHAQTGKKAASRLDPLAIEAHVPVYQAKDADERWTVLEDEAAQKGRKPIPYNSKSGKGKPSAVNHGNVTPSLDEQAGGVTVDYALQTTVLSLSALRQLRFPKDTQGEVVPRENRAQVEDAAHAMLAALGIAAIAFGVEGEHFLRSRCHLVPEGELKLEQVSRTGQVTDTFHVTGAQAAELLARAIQAAGEVGLKLNMDPVRLKPAPKLAEMVRLSRAGSVQEDA